jgi:hypothetical protein
MPALADELRVTINQPAGIAPLEFRLKGPDVRSFWQRWNRLPESSNMVALGDGRNYAGLLIRVPGSERQIRLFGGTGSDGEKARADELRVLERWVLAKAPPPLGPALVAELDQQVQLQAAASGTAAPPRPRKAQEIILACRDRARRNHDVRVRCLEEALRDNTDHKAYADALEEAATGLLP